LRTFATSEVVMTDLLLFNNAKVPGGTRIIDIIAELERALLAYKGHIHPATLSFMFITKLPPPFRAELFARPNAHSPPADGDAATCEKAFRTLMEAARSVATSIKFSTVGGVSHVGPKHDPMVLGAFDNNSDDDDQYNDSNVLAAARGVGDTSPSREGYLRSKRLCVRCGLSPEENPPASVCPKHWKGPTTPRNRSHGSSASSGKATQC
jgi:hypothetical protein